ncbi:hypothetical protein BRADI_4g21945v3 [Brachypodium distachyon]|uniref:Uncharacterized protein n=1 Tax=Brachypodium distachyon TaxID=15368 RepID=A0A2K2CPC6_BRADI|nr:hypothetical protein BRADI_4g21945v3 [Brachypodium distachyon]
MYTWYFNIIRRYCPKTAELGGAHHVGLSLPTPSYLFLCLKTVRSHNPTSLAISPWPAISLRHPRARIRPSHPPELASFPRISSVRASFASAEEDRSSEAMCSKASMAKTRRPRCLGHLRTRSGSEPKARRESRPAALPRGLELEVACSFAGRRGRRFCLRHHHEEPPGFHLRRDSFTISPRARREKRRGFVVLGWDSADS